MDGIVRAAPTPPVRVGAIDRIAMLDVLRGLAILAILYMNIPAMAGYTSVEDPRIISWTLADRWAFGGVWLIEGTMRGLLQLLFGAGMMISLRHSMRPDGPVGPLDAFLRRNLWLIAFGLFNAFVLMWPGDILLLYGLTALFLPAFRLMRPRTLFAIGAGLSTLAIMGGGIPDYVSRAERIADYRAAQAVAKAGKPLSKAQQEAIEEGRKMEDKRSFPPRGAKAEDIKKEREARRSALGEYYGYLAEQWSKWQLGKGLVFGLVETLLTMLVGAAFYAWGVIQGKRSTQFYWRLLIGCYGVGLAVRGLAIAKLYEFPTAIEWPLARFVIFSLDEAVRLPIAVGHIALVALVLRAATGARLLRPLAASGQLPLTTYFTASAVTMLVLFAPWGADLWGVYGAAGQVAIATAIIAAQIVAANLWLRHYETGPFEWLWKTLAYGRRQPFARLSQARPAGAGAQAAE